MFDVGGAKQEFSWGSFLASQKPVECLSEREQHFKELDAMEATARREMEEDAPTKKPMAANIAACAAQAAAAKSRKAPASGAVQAGAAYRAEPRTSAGVGELTRKFEQQPAAAAEKKVAPPKASQSKVSEPHPVYSQMAQGRTPAMKKIVLPPSGAYC